MKKALYWVWLALKTPPANKGIRSLIKEVSDAEAIYNMSDEELRLFPYINKVSLLKLMEEILKDL